LLLLGVLFVSEQFALVLFVEDVGAPFVAAGV